MARGNARQDIVCDDLDRDRLTDGLAHAVGRFGWHVFAFAVLSNHLHLVLKTPQPNLARGMQSFLSSYANAWARRHRFSGHVFQGRYRTELVEDETYLWVLTRYVHLNPVRAGLVADPAAWPWSSYPGYARAPRRRDWVAYDDLLAAWDGACGGPDPGEAYRRFVTAGLADPPPSPVSGARRGWILGSESFVEDLRRVVGNAPPRERRSETRGLLSLDLGRVCQVVSSSYGVEASELSRRGSRHPARAALAYLARRYTSATNGALVPVLGVSRAESVPNLTRRFATWLQVDASAREHLGRMEQMLNVLGPGEKTIN
jgi:REP element-mobilizing transposase RayT